MMHYYDYGLVSGVDVVAGIMMFVLYVLVAFVLVLSSIALLKYINKK